MPWTRAAFNDAATALFFVCVFARCLCLIRLYRYPSRSVLPFDATGVRVEANQVVANRHVKGTTSAAIETAQA